jgi:fermentation-respiration switch protein FrsA (DUF1100 family)
MLAPENNPTAIGWVRAGMLAVLLAALGAAMWDRIENQLIFMPTGELWTDPAAQGLAWEEVRLRTDDDVGLYGWFLPAEGGPTVLYLHGNAGNIADRLSKLACVVEQGFPVLLVDYRGYGRSEGRPSEGGVYRDALAMYRYLTEQRGLSPDRIAVWGMSLGGAVAVEVASRVPVGRLIVESSFTSARDMAPLVLPFWPRRLVVAEFDSEAKIAKLRMPKLFLHGDADTVVPWEQGRRLYEAAAEPKTFVNLPGADHNDALLPGNAEYLQAVVSFLRGEPVD